MSTSVSRRDFFTFLARPFRAAAEAPALAPALPVDAVAIIQGRHCLAYRSVCSVCVERCPVPDAIRVERGIPLVNLNACTGCGVCAQVCPAPVPAVLLVPRRRTLARTP